MQNCIPIPLGMARSVENNTNILPTASCKDASLQDAKKALRHPFSTERYIPNGMSQ